MHKLPNFFKINFLTTWVSRSPPASLIFASFRRKPESRHTGFTPLLWIPAFAGMTVPEQLYYQFHWRHGALLQLLNIAIDQFEAPFFVQHIGNS